MIPTVERVLFLKAVDLFKQLPGEDLALVALIADEVQLPRGHVVFREGDIGEELYLILEGQVRVHRDQQTLAELGEKECFGEMSLLDSEPRSATVTVTDDLIALKIRREDFAEMIAGKGEIAMGIIKVLTYRLRLANAR